MRPRRDELNVRLLSDDLDLAGRPSRNQISSISFRWTNGTSTTAMTETSQAAFIPLNGRFVNDRMVSKDTKQDLVLAPTAYWHMFLKPKLEKLLRKKLAQNRSVRCDETSVIVSVTGRSGRDLTKRFDDIDVDWSIVEKQLLVWGELFRAGKKLRVDLSFNYLDHSSSSNTSMRGSKRGSSATQQMLSERAAQLDPEAESSVNHPSGKKFTV
jgi:hypothetical protein